MGFVRGLVMCACAFTQVIQSTNTSNYKKLAFTVVLVWQYYTIYGERILELVTTDYNYHLVVQQFLTASHSTAGHFEMNQYLFNEIMQEKHDTNISI